MKAKQFGLCVHGQTASQLARLLKSDGCPEIAKKAIVMIGTNDVLKVCRVPSVTYLRVCNWN